MNEKNFHGSDIEAIASKYNISQDKLLNFSSNVNPLGFSESTTEKLKSHIHLLTRYPDPDYTELLQALSAYTNCPPSYLILGHGATDLIHRFFQQLQPKSVVIVGPTYSEYEREATSAFATCTSYLLDSANDFYLDVDHLAHSLPDDCDLIVLCNPNNPTAGYIEPERIKRLANLGKEKHFHLLIDETYIEFEGIHPSRSSLSLTPAYDNITVLRGFSKFYAAPGLRIGYAITSNQTLRNDLTASARRWSINALAAKAAVLMLEDQEHVLQSQRWFQQEKAFVLESLRNLDALYIYPSNTNFFLLQMVDGLHTSHALFEDAIKQGIMLRNLAGFKGLDDSFFRFCLLQREENKIMLEFLNDYFKQ